MAAIDGVLGQHEELDADEGAAHRRDAVVDARVLDVLDRPRAGPPDRRLPLGEHGLADLVARLSGRVGAEVGDPLRGGVAFRRGEIDVALIVDVAAVLLQPQAEVDRRDVVGIGIAQPLIAEVVHIGMGLAEVLGQFHQLVEVVGVGELILADEVLVVNERDALLRFGDTPDLAVPDHRLDGGRLEVALQVVHIDVVIEGDDVARERVAPDLVLHPLDDVRPFSGGDGDLEGVGEVIHLRSLDLDVVVGSVELVDDLLVLLGVSSAPAMPDGNRNRLRCGLLGGSFGGLLRYSLGGLLGRRSLCGRGFRGLLPACRQEHAGHDE